MEFMMELSEIFRELDMLSKKNKREKFEEYVSEDGISVPRVTEILSSSIHEDFLMKWSNGLGFKHISYTKFMREAADKGTYSHYMIEKFLKNGCMLEDVDSFDIPNYFRPTVESTFTGFLKWWDKLKTVYKDVELVYSEKRLVSNYFGGTCDCVLKLDGKYWLIDFKTSNHMNFKYTLQLAAYRELLRSEGIEISGCIVLMLSKTEYTYKEYIIDIDGNEKHKLYMDDAIKLFAILTLGYVYRLDLTEEYQSMLSVK